MLCCPGDSIADACTHLDTVNVVFLPKVGLVSFKIKGLNSIWLRYSLVYLNLSLKFLTNGIPTDESLIPQESWNYPEAPND